MSDPNKLPNGLIVLAGHEFKIEDLLKRAILNARPDKVNGTAPRWVAMCDAFAVGSSVAWDLCKAFDLNPDQQMSGPICETCEENAALEQEEAEDAEFELIKPEHQGE